MSPVVRANWILAVTAVILALFQLRTPMETAVRHPPLTPLEPERIQSIRIETDGRLVEHLERHREGWFSRMQQTAVTDETWVERLLHMAELPSLTRFPVPRDPTPYGLDRPRHRLWFDGLELQWGGVEPISGRRYVRVGDTVHLVTDGYTHHLHPARNHP